MSTRQDSGEPRELLGEEFRSDVVWDTAGRMVKAHATDPDIRFKGSSAGVLSALPLYLLETGKIDFLHHVAASRKKSTRSIDHLSFNRVGVQRAAGSRYGPSSPFRNFRESLDRGRPFAVVGKSCDVTAVRNLARYDHRVDERVLYAFSMFCGRADQLIKSEQALDAVGIAGA